MERLEPGDRFPTLEAQALGDGTMTIPDDTDRGSTILLFYRGHW